MDIAAKFQVIYKDSDLYQLQIVAWNGDFGGSVQVYEAIGDLEEGAKIIQGFPSNPSDTREITFGSLDPNCAGGGVRMSFHSIGGSVRPYVEIEMVSGHEVAGTTQTALLSMHIEATAVDSFVLSLRSLETHGSGVATLSGVVQH